ncbi:MAG: 3-hydroxyacyl-CoA dehydrogenase family protein [Ruminococcus sp.]|nr:3-hydroxyacyl-CoA dehydrogenase family protein [Ruminococcus sp.]
MKIGIVGYGKMGRDIFSLFFDKIDGAEFVVLDTFGAEENSAALIKTLDKQLRRKKLTQEQYDARKEAFLFTDRAEDMADCDLVIEAVFENMGVKKELFAKLAGIVREDCLLLTNTSSLDIAEVFADISGKERCFGMHFFYPVKLTGFVELNILPGNSKKNIEKAAELVKAAGKKPIVFADEYHIYLNQILSCMVAHAIYLHDSTGASVKEIRKAISGLYTVADAFEILDSIGLGLMGGKPDAFRIERNRSLLGYSCGRMSEWLEQGCPKEPLSFLDFISGRENDTDADTGNAALSMVSLILNEYVNALEDEPGCDEGLFMEAVQDTLGLAETLADYYKEYGADAIFAELDRLAGCTGFGSYEHKDKSVWDKHLINA